jgi:hypothetical protein
MCRGALAARSLPSPPRPETCRYCCGMYVTSAPEARLGNLWRGRALLEGTDPEAVLCVHNLA